MAIERISLKDVHPLVWGDHVHRYIWAKDFCSGAVLDAACGVGYGSEFILQAEQVLSYIGVDISEEAVNAAKFHFGGALTEIIWADCYDLPFDPASFDTIVCFETLEHVTYPEMIVQEFARLLKPEGIFIGSVPSRDQEQLIDEIYGTNPFHKQRFSLAKLAKIIGQFFTQVQFYDQSLEVVDLIKMADLTFPKTTAMDANPRRAAFAPGPILFLASNYPLEAKSARSTARILPVTSLYQLDQPHNAYVRSLANQLQTEQEKTQVLTDQLAAEQDQRQKLAQTLDQANAERDQLAQSLTQTTAENSKLYQTLTQTAAAYEHRLNSQDLVTRQFLAVTGRNLLALVRRPGNVKQKFNNWLQYRVLKKNQASSEPGTVTPADSNSSPPDHNYRRGD